MQHIKDGGEDVALLPIYFQFGRYMLISSSRPGTLAANLQGIWNESVDPPWGSKYTVNINTEMNYWLAERANLADCHLPMFDLQHATRGPGSVTAKKYYGARGMVVHHNTDIWGDSGPIDGLGGGVWAMGAAWMSTHVWDHFDYGGDIGFLRAQAYPLLRENATFLLDYMVEAPAGTPYAGMLVTGPSCSPENKYKLPDGKSFNLCMGPTMDLSITRAVLTRLVEAHELLGNPEEDAELISRAKAAIKDFLPSGLRTTDVCRSGRRITGTRSPGIGIFRICLGCILTTRLHCAGHQHSRRLLVQRSTSDWRRVVEAPAGRGHGSSTVWRGWRMVKLLTRTCCSCYVNRHGTTYSMYAA